MKISLLIPTTGICSENRNWLWWVHQELNKNNEVLLNKCTEDCEVIICMTDSLAPILEVFHRQFPKIPMITYIWDWFSFEDKTKGNYPQYLKLMKKSKQVWTSTEYMVKLMKEKVKINCKIVKPCSSLGEFENIETKDSGYVVQASRRDPRYKRFEFFEKGCGELNIPFKSCHPFKYSREEYVRILSECRLLVVATCEDANTALSAIEATYLKKPVLLSDIEPHKEEFGDTANYFKNDNLEDFKKQLKKLFNKSNSLKTKKAYERIMNNFTPAIMANQINERLKRLF